MWYTALTVGQGLLGLVGLYTAWYIFVQLTAIAYFTGKYKAVRSYQIKALRKAEPETGDEEQQQEP